MKLLLDQNISFRLVEKISMHFPETRQVIQLGLTNAKDQEIWNYAKVNGFAVITFDADFYDLATLHGHPPKIIWLRMGNRTTSHLADILINRKIVINEFLNSQRYKEMACIAIE